MFKPKLIDALRSYDLETLQKDLGAGLVVGLLALPLAMAFSIASGFPPEKGLYTAVVAGFLISALGGTRMQIGGPTGAFIVIVYGIQAQYGYAGLAAATFMAGAFLIGMGLFGLGRLIKFIPYPVTVGFTSGIAVVIFSGEIKDFLGLSMSEVPAHFVGKLVAYRHAIGTVNPWALGVAGGTWITVALWPKKWDKVPGSIVAIIVAGLAAWFFNLPVETINSRFGGISAGLPPFQPPTLALANLHHLVQPAITIALLGAIESLLSAVVADGMTGGQHDSDTELVAQGVANLASPLFGGIPATGAIARTATNIKNGARTPFAGIVHALVLLLILLVFGPLAGRIPLAALAGLLGMVCYHMSEWRSFRALAKGPREEMGVLLVTFFLTVFVDLTAAVEVGVILGAFLFIKEMADSAHLRAFNHDLQESPLNAQGFGKVPKDIQIFEVRGTFFFGAADKLMELIRILKNKPRGLILDFSRVTFLDASALNLLERVRRECARLGTQLYLCHVPDHSLAAIRRGHHFKEHDRHVVADLRTALHALSAGRGPGHVLNH